MKPARITNSLFPVFPSLIDKFFEGDFFNSGGEIASQPAINIRNTNSSFIIEVAIPGRLKTDFSLTSDNGELTIASEASNENSENNDCYIRREFHPGPFRRVVNFPEKLVETDKIEARYTNGVLTITLPKREEAKPMPARTIEIT